MKRKNYKGACKKRNLPKCKGVCRTYSDLQYKYADMLEADEDVVEYEVNVPLDGLDYTSDFVFTTRDGTLHVMECIQRKLLSRPTTIKMLDLSLAYWRKRGVIMKNWGIVTNAEE